MRNDTADDATLLGSNTGKVLLVARWHVRVPILGGGRGDDALNVAGRVILDLRQDGGRDSRGEGIDCRAPFGLCGHAGVVIGNVFDDVGCLEGQLVDGKYEQEGGENHLEAGKGGGCRGYDAVRCGGLGSGEEGKGGGDEGACEQHGCGGS